MDPLLRFGILSVVIIWYMSAASILYSQNNPCVMQPSVSLIEFPEDGFHNFNGLLHGIFECDDNSVSNWTIYNSGDFNLYVYADGPLESGRFWHITYGISHPEKEEPIRGLCFETSTIGVRTLQSLDEPLQWISDLDDDGKPEIILWNSFPLRPEATNVEYGLIAWVYKSNETGVFRIDLELTKNIARKLASSHQESICEASLLL